MATEEKVKVDAKGIPIKAINAVFRVEFSGGLTLARLASFVRAAYSVGADEDTEVFTFWFNDEEAGYGSPDGIEVYTSILPEDDLLNAHRIEI